MSNLFRNHFWRWLSILPVAIALLTPAGTRAASDPAGDYPQRAVRLVVPFSAGGGSDTVARLVARKLSEAWGQPVVVENKPGASGILGTELALRAKPDGYTILMGATPLVQLQATARSLPYDTFQDLVPIARIALSSDVLAVPAALGIDSAKTFIESAKERGGYSYGSYGNGTSSHMHGELLRMQTGITFTHVAYKGSGPMVQDLLAGHLDAAFAEIVSIRGHLDSPRISVLAVTGERRLQALPDTPTFTELGYSDFEPNGWYALFMRSGTPEAIVRKVSAQTLEILDSAEMLAHLRQIGLEPAALPPAEFEQIMHRDAEIWRRIAKSANTTTQ